MKKLLLTLAISLVAGFASANCGNGPNDVGNGCSGNVGPAGVDGINGTNGTDGINGSNGADGVNAKDGTDGKDASARVMPVLDLALRVYDGKYIQLQAFNVVHLKDRNHRAGAGSTEFMAGARIVIKLGSSYEEREIEKLKKLLAGR